MNMLFCHEPRRRDEIRRHPDFNGLDYLEVDDKQRELTLYFLGKAPADLRPANITISGGRRITRILATSVNTHPEEADDLDDHVVVSLDRAGDHSIYSLCLHDIDEEGGPRENPLPGFDARYNCLDFSFKAGCPSDLDCLAADPCPPPTWPAPEISYLARDYASFRKLLLERMTRMLPDWRERHVPDLGVTLVELLAYAGDRLSYYQDSVATEAYLHTARRRISVRRHARLVDYYMHEGNNARAFVHLATDTDLEDLDPADFFLITAANEAFPLKNRVLGPDDIRHIPAEFYEVFEPLASFAPIRLKVAHNEIHFYSWGEAACCLPRCATRATLIDGRLVPPGPNTNPDGCGDDTDGPQATVERDLDLRVGDLLIFEEVIGPRTGVAADADPAHRHAVRLTSVEPGMDTLLGQPVLEICWGEEDALPFPLCLSAHGGPDCLLIENISVARGNIVPVDHGRTLEWEELGCVAAERLDPECGEPCPPRQTKIQACSFHPCLERKPLSYGEPIGMGASACRILSQQVREALPLMELESRLGESVWAWQPRFDLLASGAMDRHFVTEIDNDGWGHLRFGDGRLGHVPGAGSCFRTRYRIGNGAIGNVGAETISHIVLRELFDGAALLPRNPMAASGGTDPEPIGEVKMFAPDAFRHHLERAITADDYAHIAVRDFACRVQGAHAVFCWSGSRKTVVVAIDPRCRDKADPELLAEIETHLCDYRRIGHGLRVVAADYVPLDLEICVCAEPGALRGHVKAALLDAFSNRVLVGGTLGFFHPDMLRFGASVQVSAIAAAAQALPGVAAVTLTRLQRLFEVSRGELAEGELVLTHSEIARLDNDPGAPENGRLNLIVRGGR